MQYTAGTDRASQDGGACGTPVADPRVHKSAGAERKKIGNETSTEVWQPGHLSPHRLNYNESRVATQEYAAKNEIA